MKKLFYRLALEYLRFAAKIQLAKIKPTIIGVGGSSGKTSLTRFIADMLSDTSSVKGSEGKNSETGIPLDILDIHMRDSSKLSLLLTFLAVPIQLLTNWKKYEFYVVEMGIDSPVEPKNMSYLLKIIQPTIGIVTNVSLEHSLYFEPYTTEIDPEKKQQEILQMTAEQETMLLKSLPEEGIAIINNDDTSITQAARDIRAHMLTISVRQKADIVVENITNTLSECTIILSYDNSHYTLTLPQPLPKHFAYEFSLALGVGISLDIPFQECIDALQKHFSLPAGRLSFFEGIKHTTLIDSSYNNATLPPILDILDFVKEVAGKRRKVAIIGDLRELGEESEYHHVQVAKKLLKTVDLAILIGPQLETFAVPILEKEGFPFENFPHVASALPAIIKSVKEDDVILVKGSQNTLFLERVVEKLLADKKDVDKLTRRGEFWDKKRSETP